MFLMLVLSPIIFNIDILQTLFETKPHIFVCNLKKTSATLLCAGCSLFFQQLCLSMLMKIFLSRSHPAPDVALRFVGVKHLACFPGQGWVDLEEPLGDIWWCQGRNKKICSFLTLYHQSILFDRQHRILL